MKPWSERISSVSCCRQLSVQEDAVLRYRIQTAETRSHVQQKVKPDLSSYGNPTCGLLRQTPATGERHIRGGVELTGHFFAAICGSYTLLRFVLLCEGNHLRYPRFYVLVTVRIPVREPDRSANSSSAHISVRADGQQAPTRADV